MKKICFVLVLVLALSLLIACGGETTTATTTDSTPATDATPAPQLPEGERVVKSNYVAVLEDAEWNPGTLDGSFDLVGTGSDIYSQVNKTYGKTYAITFVVVQNGEETTYTPAKVFSALKALGVSGANVELDETAKKATIKVYPQNCTVQSSWKAVNAQSCTYIRFEFTASLPIEYRVTVTPKSGEGDSLYTHSGIKVEGEGNTYKGMGQLTVPAAYGKTYYVNIYADGSDDVLASFPLNVTQGKYNVPYRLVFVGDWTYLKNEEYFEDFVDAFYNVYPRLMARWGGTGKEPMEVTLLGRLDYSGVAYSSGATVGYSIDYLDSSWRGVGSLAHELTHSVQKYHYIYGKPHYFTENMANYGRHRYYAYGYSYDFIEEKSLSSSLDWGYSEYGNAQLFFSWMDWTYPTLDKNGDGKVQKDERGLLDTLVFNSKEWTGANIDDDPKKEGSVFNNWVKEYTGFKTFDLLRQEFARQATEGEWTFIGFGEYQDNWVTENIPGCPNPEYPMKKEIQPTATSHTPLATAITTGDNLCIGAIVKKVAQSGTSGNPAENLIDGDLTNRYQAKRSGNLYNMTKIANEIEIDLGEQKTFDTYTFVFYATQSSYLAKKWEISVSNDGATYTAIDAQLNNTESTVSVSFDEVTARYVKIRLFEPDSQAGVTRISEFMLFNKAD